MLLNAIRTLTPLLNSRRTPAQYYEAVEALVWLQSSNSEPFFDALGWDPDVVRTKIDLPLYSDLALQDLEANRISMIRMYIADTQYVLKLPEKSEIAYNKLGGAKIPYTKLVEFAKKTLDETEVVLRSQASPNGSSVEPPTKILELLEQVEELHGPCNNGHHPPSQENGMASRGNNGRGGGRTTRPSVPRTSTGIRNANKGPGTNTSPRNSPPKPPLNQPAKSNANTLKG
jgi:hypothetical protein